MKNFRIGAMRTVVLAGLLACLPVCALGDTNQLGQATSASAQAALQGRIRHGLLMLPYYGVFDDLQFQINGNQVVLSGEVTRPVLKYDAENAVKHIAGVSGVTNDIKVLPLSRYDDLIRIATYRAVFGRDSMYRYAMGAIPSIHIIVDNGKVTLVGMVSNKMDSIIANMAANTVPGVFSVTNNLRVG
jgi:BON domain